MYIVLVSDSKYSYLVAGSFGVSWIYFSTFAEYLIVEDESRSTL